MGVVNSKPTTGEFYMIVESFSYSLLIKIVCPSTILFCSRIPLEFTGNLREISREICWNFPQISPVPLSTRIHPPPNHTLHHTHQNFKTDFLDNENMIKYISYLLYPSCIFQCIHCSNVVTYVFTGKHLCVHVFEYINNDCIIFSVVHSNNIVDSKYSRCLY